MLLTHNQRAAINAAEVNRAYMARTGLTRAGQMIWTSDEVAALRCHYPDRKACLHALPRRTWRAIEGKAGRLGLTRPRIVWEGNEVAALRRRYPTQEAVGAMAQDWEKSRSQVYGKASAKRVRRPKRRPLPAKDPLVDAVRQRAFDLGISLAGLDTDVRRGKCFVYRNGRRDVVAIVRAMRLLGGRFEVTFR